MTTDAQSFTTNPRVIQNTQDPQQPLLTVNLTNVTKLSGSNYLTWKLQIQAPLDGYKLQRFVDSHHTSPLPTIELNDTTVPNPAYNSWLRQDRLLFLALLGSLSTAVQSLVARTTTSLELWCILAQTYPTPSCGHIKQLKEKLRRCTKGTQTIGSYMQDIKACADALALLDKPIDDEDIVDRDLAGLGDDYRSVTDVINIRDTAISFPELHEKLLNKEALLLNDVVAFSPFPVTVNPIVTANRSNSRNPTNRPDFHQ